MKQFLLLAALICAHEAFAAPAISQAKAKILSMNGATVTVEVTVNGCLDKIGETFSRYEVKNGKGILYFAALNVHDERSQNTHCFIMPTEIFEVPAGQERDIELVNINFTHKLKK